MSIVYAFLVFFALAQAKMNFLFLQCDSMDGRLVDPSSIESRAAYTPTMNKLAQTGVNFASTYTPSPQCVPSRAAMWTGLRNDQIDVWNNDQGLCKTWVNYTCTDQNVTGLFTLWDTPLRDAGYQVALLGRVDMGGGYGGGFHGTQSGLAIWTRSANITKPTTEGPELSDNAKDPYANDDVFINDCVKYLEQYDSDAPFFLHCGTLIPHPGFTTNSTWLDLINKTEITLPTWQDYDTMHPFDKYMIMTKCVLPGDCTGQNATEDLILHTRALYYATVAETDAKFARVLEALQKTGKYNETIIIFTSDHGEMNMEHRQYLKNSMYEGSTRVPLIFSHPSFLQGVTVYEHTSLLDIFPTLMELSAATSPPNLQGDSLVPFLKQQNPPKDSHKDYVFSQYHSNFGNTGSFMIRQGDWKYITFGTNPPFQDYHPLLFNVSSDPGELHDVSTQYPNITSDLDNLITSEIINYVEVDAYVKKQDYKIYMSWQEDGHQDDYFETFWEQNYKGFDSGDQALAQAWIDNGPFGEI